MKKLILTALAIAGLASSSAQGAAAMAAGLGAKAYGFLQAAAPISAFGLKAFNLGKMAVPALTAAGTGYTCYEAFMFMDDVRKKLNILAPVVPTTWYGKVWNGLCSADMITDVWMGKIQKCMFLASIFGGCIGLLTNKAQAESQESGEDALVDKIAAKVAAAMPAATNPVMYMPRRRAARRSGMVARA